MYHQVLHDNDEFHSVVPKDHCIEVLPVSGAHNCDVPAWQGVQRPLLLLAHCVTTVSRKRAV